MLKLSIMNKVIEEANSTELSKLVTTSMIKTANKLEDLINAHNIFAPIIILIISNSITSNRKRRFVTIIMYLDAIFLPLYSTILKIEKLQTIVHSQEIKSVSLA